MVFVYNLVPKAMDMNKLLLVIGIIFITIGCNKIQLHSNLNYDQSIQSINGSWVVVSYEDLVNNTVVLKKDVDSWNGLDVVLTFATDSLYGRNTTNDVFGNFTLSGNSIHVIRYGGTKVGQPEWGNMFSDIVNNLESFEVNNKQLKFYFNSNKNSVTLSRK
jgi:hypothetical protein